MKSVLIPNSNVVVELYLFDCAGQSVFNQREFGQTHVRTPQTDLQFIEQIADEGTICCLSPQYKTASMTMVIFDVNNKESFKGCSKWYQDVLSAVPKHAIPGKISIHSIS